MIALEGQGEAWRNRLLRRIDWRFLAGKSHARRALVPGGGMLAQALELVSEKVLVSGQFIPGNADLVALINPNRDALRQAWHALEPGGVLYGEWYLPRPGGLSALRLRLAELGFLTAGSYWPWPWPERSTPAFWLPLEAPGALSYFLENRPPVHSLPARWLRLSLQRSWRLGLRAEMLAPVCIVAYKPLALGDETLPPESLSARAERWGLAKDGSGLDWLLVTGGLHSTNKVTGLIFQRGAGVPDFVIKMPRRELSLSSLEREASVLQAVQSGGAGYLPGVPELIFLNLKESFPAIGETYLAGSPLYTAMHTERMEELAQKATRWLLTLVRPGPPQPPAAWWDRLVQPALDEFMEGYSTVGGKEVMEAARSEFNQIGSLPLAIEHGDFSPWNVHITPSGDLSVLDWEGAELNGLPISDLVYFLAYLTFFAERALETGTASSAFRRMLDPRTRVGSIAEACIREYCAVISLPAEAIRPLRLLTWLRHAVMEQTLIKNSGIGEPDPKLLRGGLFLSLLKTELEMGADG
jgi:hypothetical protein